MPLERDHILLYGPKEIVEDGVRIRNKVLQPCGCWSAEVWRAPMAYNATKREFELGTAFTWQHDACQCHVHSAKVAVLQWQLVADVAALRVLETGGSPEAATTVRAAATEALVAKLGDGAKRLHADTERVLAEANALDREIRALEQAEGGIKHLAAHKEEQ